MNINFEFYFASLSYDVMQNKCQFIYPPLPLTIFICSEVVHLLSSMDCTLLFLLAL